MQCPTTRNSQFEFFCPEILRASFLAKNYEGKGANLIVRKPAIFSYVFVLLRIYVFMFFCFYCVKFEKRVVGNLLMAG